MWRVLRRRSLVAGLACAVLAALAAAAVASGAVWTTYHHDAARSGVDPDSTSPVTPTQAWQSAPLDGPVWGEPLVYGSTVYVATENNTVYALNAETGAMVWPNPKPLATPVPSGKLPCGDIGPNVGITSTPVIDPSTGRIYVVADTWNGTSAAHELYGLNLSDGSVAVGPVPVDPPGSTPLDQLQRASLALDAGKVIIGYGGNDGDCGSYHGWLVAVPEGGGALQTFEVDSSGSQGAIWGAGNAPAIDSLGDIWVSTGNGNSTNLDFQESVIKLDTNLAVLDSWAPSTWKMLDNTDTDLGSTMPLLLANTGLVFEIGKQGVGYLLSTSQLGTGPLYQAQVCSGSWGGGIYVNGVIYVACSDGMHALALNTASRTFSPVSSWSVDSNAVGPPIYAGGLVWAAGATATHTDGLLSALNPQTGASVFSANLRGFEHFATPSAGDGLLFVANQTGLAGNLDQITAFRIANASATPSGPPSAPSPSGSGIPPKPLPPPPTISTSACVPCAARSG